MSGINRAAISMVLTERKRQEKKFGERGMTCANPDMDPLLSLAVLMEEVGEVAHELNDEYPFIDLDKLREELVQVAAVAVAWVEGVIAQQERVRLAVRS